MAKGSAASRNKAQKAKVVDSTSKVVATNRQARRNFDVIDTYEAGMVLVGSEVKSLRESKVQLAEAFARVENGQVFLLNLHIAPYSKSTSIAFGHIVDRKRKLLLNRSEINKLDHRMATENLTLIPLSLYFKEGRAKVELALARGKNVHDKRQTIVDRDLKIEADRAMREAGKR